MFAPTQQMDMQSVTSPGNESRTNCEVGVVVINYRTPDMTIDCLESLAVEANANSDLRVVIVDNASGDDSADRIEQTITEKHWNEWTKLVRSPDNLGFSAGNNTGINSLDAKFYLLLNSDALVRPGAIQTLVDVIQQHDDVAVVSPRLEWPDATPQISCFRHHSIASAMIEAAQTGPITRLLSRFNVPLAIRNELIEPEWASFACVMIRAEAIRETGPMDEGFFMYFEDADYCRRLRRKGWRIVHQPEAHVVHLRGGSSPVKSLKSQRKRRPRYYYAARNRYYAKHYGLTGLWLANVMWLLGRAIALPREWVGLKERHTCAKEAMDIWTNGFRPLKPRPHQGETRS